MLLVENGFIWNHPLYIYILKMVAAGTLPSDQMMLNVISSRLNMLRLTNQNFGAERK